MPRVVAVGEAVAAVRARSALAPEVGIILGTGLGGLARELAVEARIAYTDLPGFPPPTVESHAGALLLGTLGGRPVAALAGRYHLYEGYSPAQVTFPTRVLHALGARTLIVSNACGGMHPLWHAGDLMVIADHLNLLFANPLARVAAGEGEGAPAFTDCTQAYDPALRALALAVARERGVTAREGVYVAVPGPCLETPAEYRMLRGMGADVVGMSTVPEVLVARELGMRVLGISLITDMCLPDALEEASLEKILAVAARAEPGLTAVVRGVVERLAA